MMYRPPSPRVNSARGASRADARDSLQVGGIEEPTGRHESTSASYRGGDREIRRSDGAGGDANVVARKHGGVAEWLRQGPAKPRTAVRFRPPPPTFAGGRRFLVSHLPGFTVENPDFASSSCTLCPRCVLAEGARSRLPTVFGNTRPYGPGNDRSRACSSSMSARKRGIDTARVPMRAWIPVPQSDRVENRWTWGI